METKLYDKNCITLDGRLDEAVWATAQEYTGFKKLQDCGGEKAPMKTTFRILPCEDRVYFGVWCEEPDMEQLLKIHHKYSIWCTDSVELFISPSGNNFDFYHFAVTLSNKTVCRFWSEGGNIQPDPYAPQWQSATYVGKDYWSAEIEIPLTAFYMTSAASWRNEWLFNICRTRVHVDNCQPVFYTWSDLKRCYKEPTSFSLMGGFPMLPATNEIRMTSASVDITEKTDKGVAGTLTVRTTNPEDAEFEFSSENADTVSVALKAGNNEFTVPCFFTESGRLNVELQLKRKSDGEIFKRWYPVRVAYEPIKLELTLPEFRGNFYPGQDYSKVVGRVISRKPVTVTLEGPGIGTKSVTPDVDGNFTIDTSSLEFGVAMLTITDSVNTFTKKIRRLEPNGKMMTWISGGNLIVNGKPVLRRNMYAEYYQGGEAFKLRYDADDLHMTPEIKQSGFITPGRLMKGADAPGGEATKDQMPSEEMLRLVDAAIEADKDRDFAYYYLEDEPECRSVSPIYLKHMYDYITDKDPYHVILMASRNANELVDCADWIETHPYINVEIRDGKRGCARPINTLAGYVEAVSKLNRPDKCVGFLPTCFAYKDIYVHSEYPNFDEMICHVWAAMIAGGKSLWPFAYLGMNDRPALYEGIRYVFSSFEALEDIVLLAKRTELIHTKQIHAAHYKLDDQEMFALANLVPEPQKVTLDGISGTWYNFRHGGTITGNTFELKPYEVVVGTTKVRDGGLPTYQETAALIDKKEYERTHGGSLLFDRSQDIKVTASGFGRAIKLFDGVRDNFGWEYRTAGVVELRTEGEKFFEMDLTKVNPTFSKVVVHGFPIDDMTIKVRNGGELSVPAIAQVQTEKFSTTFNLAESICPDCLRLEFGDHKVELYEIEVFE